MSEFARTLANEVKWAAEMHAEKVAAFEHAKLAKDQAWRELVNALGEMQKHVAAPQTSEAKEGSNAE